VQHQHRESISTTVDNALGGVRVVSLMGRAARWSVAVALSVAVFAFGWWVCARLLHRDEGISLGIASAALAIVVVIAGWWAGRELPGKDSGDRARNITQRVRAGRDAYVAGRDLTINRPREM
jgi:hypothetical protein